MVITVDKNKRPLGFVTERRARILLTNKRACVYRYFPFVIIIKDVDARKIEGLPAYRIKIDPGSVHDGIAIVDEKTGDLMYAMQVEHRGQQVKKNLETRKACRRNRRNRETLYRRPKFKDGGNAPTSRKDGWLPPSVRSVTGNTETWIRRLCRYINIIFASMEDVRIDTQKIDDPGIEGKKYQQGTLAGYEIREYLLEKYQHTCQYCGGESKDPVLEWEHKVPKSRGGSDSVRNATLACRCCNQAKGSMRPEEWLESIQKKTHLSDLDKVRIKGIGHVIAGTLTGGSNRYCAWVNAGRKELEGFLVSLFGREKCEFAGGGRTKYNRIRAGLPKDHQYDAWCVGKSFRKGMDLTHGYYVNAKATGRGTHFRGKTNVCGIITKKLPKREKRVYGFMNGDIVRADVPHKEPRPYKYEGRYTGRVMTRASGSFDIRTKEGLLVTAKHSFCSLLQKADGYQYSQKRTKEGAARPGTAAIPLGNELPRILAVAS